MDGFIEYFEHIPTAFRAILLIGGLVFFWILEGTIPLFSNHYKKYHHAWKNLFFTLTTMIIGFGLASVLLLASRYTSENEFGLLYLIALPLWIKVVLGVLLLDLIGAYLVHLIEHKIKWMWKFHLVHHTDTHVDVTTGLRHHPGETVFRIGFTIIAVLIIGAPMGIVMLYQSLSVLFTHITHANIKIPRNVDKFLSLLFVSPLMHKVHHHYQQPLTDSNYGNIFSIWDRMFGTFARVKHHEEIIYGIDTHMNPKENDNLKNLLVIPFQKYRAPLASKFGEEKTSQ